MKFNKFPATLIISFFLILGTKNSSAQSFMIGYGMSLFSDIVTVKYTDNHIYYIEPHVGVNFFSASLEMKINLYEFNDELALSISSSPTVGLGAPLNDDGLGNFRVPIYAQIDFGKLSTFSSSKNVGVGIGLGYQFEVYNVVGEKGPITFGTVAARIGFRFFSVNELAFKIGLPKLIPDPHLSDATPDALYNPSRQAHIASYQLSLIYYLKY